MWFGIASSTLAATKNINEGIWKTMYNYKCPFAEHKKQGFSVWLKCTLDGDVCGFTRYCMEKRDVEHSTSAPQCPLYLKNKDKVVKENDKS